MEVILSMAVSLNGMVAREDGQEDWLPAAGWDDFLADVHSFGNFIMGRETYELVNQLYPDHNFNDITDSLKVIVTRNKDYKADSGYTVVHSPEEALKIVKDKGCETALLIGGGKINSHFLSQGLVDKVWLTYNPHILGKGRPFISPEDLDISLTLLESKQLSLGRIQAHYKVNK